MVNGKACGDFIMKKILLIGILISTLLFGCGKKTSETNIRNISTANEPISTTNESIKDKSNNTSPIAEENKYQSISGTSLSFIPLLDFSKADGFAGYESLTYNTSILVMEIPAPEGNEALNYFENVLTPEVLKKKGLKYISKETNINNTKSLLIKSETNKDSIDYNQWIYIMEGNDKVAQIQVSGPKNTFTKIEDDIIKMLCSFKWNGSVLSLDTYYSIKLPDKWKLVKQIDSLEIYYESGKFPLLDGEGSISVLNLNKFVPKNEREKYIEKMNLNRNHYSNLKLLGSRNLNIDNFEANISYVSGLDMNTSKQVIKQYCYIFLDSTTVLIEGDQTEKLNKDIFENTVLTWKLRKS
ncbi:MAG TPA: hypothetical protein VF941_14010 [Clostridia bacterium]